MKRGMGVLLLLSLLELLLSCSSGQAPKKATSEETAAPTGAMTEPQPPPTATAPANPVPPPSASLADKAVKRDSTAMQERQGEAKPAAKNGAIGDKAGDGAPPAAANGGPAPAGNELWQKFLASFTHAAYTFNPPSPIKVAKPHTIHLWVDTTVSHQALAEALKKVVPADTSRVESGTIQVSPVMKATLTGENFTITPNSPEQQTLNPTGRTIWSWEITPTWPGTQTLHLRLIAIPPPGLATDPYTIPVPLDREIKVEVTFWWLIDHFFDKYWKWLLGGFGTLLVTVLGWWWKKK